MTDHYRQNAAQRARRSRENAPALARHMRQREEERERLMMYARNPNKEVTVEQDLKANVEVMRNVQNEALGIVKNYRATAGAAYRDLNLTEPAKAAKAIRARDEAIEEFRSLKAGFEEARENVQAAVSALEKRHYEDSSRTDAAAESRLSRAWARAEKRLEGGANLHTVLEGAAEAGDADTLRALYEEGEAYFEAKGDRQNAELVKSKSRELRADVEKGDLGQAVAGEYMAGKAARAAESPMAHISYELESGQACKRLWMDDGSIHDLSGDMDIPGRINNDERTHGEAIREASHG